MGKKQSQPNKIFVLLVGLTLKICNKKPKRLIFFQTKQRLLKSFLLFVTERVLYLSSIAFHCICLRCTHKTIHFSGNKNVSTRKRFRLGLILSINTDLQQLHVSRAISLNQLQQLVPQSHCYSNRLYLYSNSS